MNISFLQLASGRVALLALPYREQTFSCRTEWDGCVEFGAISSALVRPRRRRQSGPPSSCPPARSLPGSVILGFQRPVAAASCSSVRVCVWLSGGLLLASLLVSVSGVSGIKFTGRIDPLTVFKVSGTANPLTKKLASLISRQRISGSCPPAMKQFDTFTYIYDRPMTDINV